MENKTKNQPKKDNNDTALAILSTLITMVLTFNNSYFFGNGLFWNIISIPIWIFSCFMTGNLFSLIPFNIIKAILRRWQEKSETFTKKQLSVIYILSAAAISIVLGLILTIINK